MLAFEWCLDAANQPVLPLTCLPLPGRTATDNTVSGTRIGRQMQPREASFGDRKPPDGACYPDG